MTKLFINGEEVVLPEDVNIKLIIDNPYFTKSSTYSRDIKLPLKSLTNRRIFRSVNRIEVSKNIQSFDARLVVTNKIEIKGKAIVREVTEEMISLQIVTDNAEMNFIAKGEDYINQIDYGWYDMLKFPLREHKWNMTKDQYIGLFGAYNQSAEGDYGNFNVTHIFLPIYNESAGEIYNKVLGYYPRDNKLTESFYYEIFYKKRAPQPYLFFVIKTIIEKIGYKLDIMLPEDYPYYNLFIANATVTKSLNDILPKWTINEFLTEVENFLNVVFVVNGKNVEMHLASNYYKFIANRQDIDVIDEYTTTTDGDNDQDLSMANISYDLNQSEHEPYRKVDKSLIDSYEHIKCFSQADMEQKKNDLPAAQRFLVIYELLNRHYILQRKDKDDTVGEFIEINQFRDIIRDTDTDNQVSLKIVPVAIGVFEAFVSQKNSGKPIWSAPILMPSTAGDVYEIPDELDEDIANVLAYGKNEVSEKTHIEVAINNVELNSYVLDSLINEKTKEKINYPSCYTDFKQRINLNQDHRKKENLSLRLQPDSMNSSLGDYNSHRIPIDRRIENAFSYISNEIHSVKNIFIVRNQEYLAKSIELNVTAKGVEPLKKIILYKKEA